jgi:TPR repeat protein
MFCNSEGGKTDEEQVEQIMKRVAANDAASISLLGNSYHHGLHGLQRDEERAMELLTRAVDLGSSKAHNNLGMLYHEWGDLKKAKFHFEAAAMAGDEVARINLGFMEANSGNREQAVKHWTIAASAGDSRAMQFLISLFEQGSGTVSRQSIESTLTAYKNSCAEFRSEARDVCIRAMLERD